MNNIAISVVFLPLLGFLLAALFGKKLGDRRSQLVTCVPMCFATLAAIYTFVNAIGAAPVIVPLLDWIDVGSFHVNWTIRVDTLSAVMMCVVTIVSTLVHIYSVGYMSHDNAIPRFMAYLSLFTFFMLMLVSADNLVQLFFGWEGVGLASYLLIGFWYHKPSANAAAIKAFLVNRVGDIGFALGICACFYVFNTVSFDAIFASAPQFTTKTISLFGHNFHAITLITFLLFIGAMGKSAQLGLHTWLPDAMEGPTPVSALIHAATMVTAGVFMLCRMSPLFELAPDTMTIVAIIGALTAVFAATVGLTQNDIKRVIAYSTCSQLGYMFFAVGIGAYDAAMFHLVTHAFFKALLFLGAGSVIHAMSGEQDMRQMGGIWKHIPVTYALMWIGSLALAGIPIFAGYYSKDLILESAWAKNTDVGMFVFACGIAAALMTAFYSWRLIFMTFHGAPRAHERVMAHIHESPQVMLVPLYVLAIGAVCAGIVGFPYFTGGVSFWGASLVTHTHAAEHAPFLIEYLPLIVAITGIALAYLLYIARPALPRILAKIFAPLYAFSLNKWYFDEIYDFLFVRPASMFGRIFWKGGDKAVIDGLGPDGVSTVTRKLSERVSAMQTGYVYHYAFMMMLGVLVFVSWVIYGFVK